MHGVYSVYSRAQLAALVPCPFGHNYSILRTESLSHFPYNAASAQRRTAAITLCISSSRCHCPPSSLSLMKRDNARFFSPPLPDGISILALLHKQFFLIRHSAPCTINTNMRKARAAGGWGGEKGPPRLGWFSETRDSRCRRSWTVRDTHTLLVTRGCVCCLGSTMFFPVFDWLSE